MCKYNLCVHGFMYSYVAVYVETAAKCNKSNSKLIFKHVAMEINRQTDRHTPACTHPHINTHTHNARTHTHARVHTHTIIHAHAFINFIKIYESLVLLSLDELPCRVGNGPNGLWKDVLAYPLI